MNERTPESFSSCGQIFFLVQPFSNGIKGHTLLSMLSDGLIEEYLVFSIVIAREGRGTTGECEVES